MDDRPMKFDARENPRTTAEVIHALRAGLGVEDMQVRDIASAEYARMVIVRLREYDLLAGVLRPSIFGRGQRRKGVAE